MNIVTREIWPGMWMAIDSDTYDGSRDSPTRGQMGHGKTEELAIADLKEEIAFDQERT